MRSILTGLTLAVLAAGTVPAAGCAATDAVSVQDSRTHDPLQTVPFSDIGPRDPRFERRDPAENEVRTFVVEITMNTDAGTLIQAPALEVYPAQRASISLATQVAYVKTFETQHRGDAAIADPIIDILQDGMVVDVALRPVDEDCRRVALAYRVLLKDLRRPMASFTFPVAPDAQPVTIQLPAVERNEAEGTRVVDSEVRSLLARLPRPGGGKVDVFVRVVPSAMFASPDAALPVERIPFEEQEDARLVAAIAAADREPGISGRLDVRAVVLRCRLRPGDVLDEAATAVMLEEQPGAPTLGSLILVTEAVPGARVATGIDETLPSDFEVEVGMGAADVGDLILAVQRSGLAATIEEDGRLRLDWVGTPSIDTFTTTLGASVVPLSLLVPDTRSRSATLRPTRGRRLVSLGPVEGGGTAAVVVSFTPTD